MQSVFQTRFEVGTFQIKVEKDYAWANVLVAMRHENHVELRA